jgi:hypothetical protein
MSDLDGLWIVLGPKPCQAGKVWKSSGFVYHTFRLRLHAIALALGARVPSFSPSSDRGCSRRRRAFSVNPSNKGIGLLSCTFSWADDNLS